MQISEKKAPQESRLEALRENHERSPILSETSLVCKLSLSNAHPTLSPTGHAAVALTAQGLFLTPLCWPAEEGTCGCPKQHTKPQEIGKAPLLGDGYQKKLLSAREVEDIALRYPLANWGVLLKPSRLLIADADSEEADREVETRGFPPGPRVKTARGVQRYCRNTSGIIGRTIKRGDSRSLDILTAGYSVIPPSVHRMGAVYSWEIPFAQNLLEDPPVWALSLLGESIHAQGEIDSLPQDLPLVDVALLPVPAWVKEVIYTGQTSHPDKYPSRSEAVYAVIMALLEAQCDLATIASVMFDPQNRISEKPREQGRSWLAADIARARAKAKGNGHANATADDSQTTQESLPKIIVTNRPLRDISGDAVDALQRKNDPPFIFLRSHSLARVIHDERGRPLVEPLSEHALRGYLTRSAEFIRIGAKEKESHIAPPMETVLDIMTLPDRPFPPLVSIVECPVLRPDGTILDHPGYDPATRLFYKPDPRLHVPSISETPSQQAARDARDFIVDELLSDFPFTEGANLANFMALLLSPILRPAISGCVPMCLLDKPGPGSGATLLADIVSTIATGQHARKEPAPEGKFADEEWRKKITSLLMTGEPVIVWDNIEEQLRSSALSAVLTTPLWGDRQLGENKQLTLANRAVWIATGNNIALRGDIARRCYRVRIDPQEERPWTREGFKHPDLLSWCTAHRGELLAHLLTMARAWFVAGTPKAITPKLGGFDEWVSTVGGILSFAGLSDFLGNLDDLYNSVDDEGPQWRLFLHTWFEELEDRLVTVRYLAGLAQTQPRILESLPDSVNWDEKKLEASRKNLGKALKKRAFRVYGNYRLEQGTQELHAKVAQWQVIELRGSRG